MASLLQNVAVSRHPFQYDSSGLTVSGFTRMRPYRLREIIRSEFRDGKSSRKPSVNCRVQDRNFMTNIDWMVAQLELYGIDTQMEREQPWELPDALETALEDHLLDEPTDHVTAVEAKLKRKYRRERLRRIDEILGRYRAGSSQRKELLQIRRSIRADIKRDRRDREMEAIPDTLSSETPTRVQHTDFDRECSSSSAERTSETQAGESALGHPSDQLASIAAVEDSQGARRSGLTSRVTSRTNLNTLPEQAPSHVEQPQRLSSRGVRASHDEFDSDEAQLQSPRWNAFNSLSEEANYDPEFFVAKHFLDKSRKRKDQTKTPLPIALTSLNDPKSLTRFARNRSVVVRMVPDALSSTLILGWNGQEVKDIASSYPTRYPERCKKRKAEWELSPESKRKKRDADRQRRWQQSTACFFDKSEHNLNEVPSDFADLESRISLDSELDNPPLSEASFQVDGANLHFRQHSS